MKRTLATAATAALIALSAAACGSAPASTPPAPALPAAEQSAVTAMTAHCTQDAAQIAAMVAETHTLEVKAGIRDESAAALAGHLETAVSRYKSKVDCSDPFAAYLTIREG